MGLRISGLNELRERLERLRLEEVMAKALAEQAQRIAARVREGLSEPPGGAGHNEPWLRSGALRNSVGAQADGLQAAVGSSDPAAVPQELGTTRMPPRPFLAPVAAAMSEEVARAVGAAIAAALRGDGPDAGSTDVDLCGDGPDGSDLPGGGAVAGGGAPASTVNANATGTDGPLPAANGASPNRPAPELFAGPGTPTSTVRPGTVTPGHASRLGDLSMRRETGYNPGQEGIAAGVVSRGATDPGGVSYGAYQLTSSGAGGRQVQAFLKSPEGARWADRFKGMDPTQPAGPFSSAVAAWA